MNKIKKTSTLVLACTAGCFLSSTNADILFFLLDEGEQGAWEAALDAERLEVYEAFNTTEVWGDPGIAGLDGPIYFGDIGIDSNLHPFGEGGRAGRGGGGNGLTLVGASAGFGNADTAVVAGYFVDSFDIFSVGEFPTALEIRVTSFLSSNTAAITVYDPNENEIVQLPSVVATPVGTRLGILATDGDVLGRINIYDAVGGAEGISGDVITYIKGPPASAQLLGLEIVTGALLGGEVADIAESDDSYVSVRSGLGRQFSEAHLMDIIVVANTDVVTPEFLNITLEAHLTEPNGVAKVRLRNWRTGVFERVAQYNLNTQDEVVNFEGIEAGNYIRLSGAIDLSIKHVVFVPFLSFRFESWLDHVQITVE